MDRKDFTVLEQIARTFKGLQRQAATRAGLPMVHFDILDYLSQANRLSDTPQAVADFLGLTKGTVSQSIQLLEQRGFLEKMADSRDKRMVHLRLTDTGRAVAAQINKDLEAALAPLEISGAYRGILGAVLGDLWGQMRARGSGRTFGACASCRHGVRLPENSMSCRLLDDIMTAEETAGLCRHYAEAG